MAQKCPHCRGTDLLAGLTYAQCLTCGQLSDYEGKPAAFGPDANTLALASAGLTDTADYAAAQHAPADTVEAPKKGSKNG